MIRALLARRREFRERVQREAADLMNLFDDEAYREARQRARVARDGGNRADYRLWCKVAVEIANRTGHEIGVKGADRYPDPGPRPEPVPRSRREIADRLVEISRGIGALSAGRGDATTIHNVGVAARQIVDLAGSTPALVLAADDVIAACEDVEAYPKSRDLLDGRYPQVVDEAGRALQRLRQLALP